MPRRHNRTVNTGQPNRSKRRQQRPNKPLIGVQFPRQKDRRYGPVDLIDELYLDDVDNSVLSLLATV